MCVCVTLKGCTQSVSLRLHVQRLLWLIKATAGLFNVNVLVGFWQVNCNLHTSLRAAVLRCHKVIIFTPGIFRSGLFKTHMYEFLQQHKCFYRNNCCLATVIFFPTIWSLQSNSGLKWRRSTTYIYIWIWELLWTHSYPESGSDFICISVDFLANFQDCTRLVVHPINLSKVPWPRHWTLRCFKGYTLHGSHSGIIPQTI